MWCSNRLCRRRGWSKKQPIFTAGISAPTAGRAFGFSRSGNSEILAAWLVLAVRFDYRAADDALESFLIAQGRRKFLEPLYREPIKSVEGTRRARAIYERARPTYHSVAIATIDPIVDGG